MDEIKITIPGELCDLNTYINAERTHRQAGAKIKKRETQMVEWVVRSLKKPHIDYPVMIHNTWHTKDKKKDPDNVAFAKKFILDGMVKAGLLKNDGRKQIIGFSDSFKVDKNNPRVDITITPASEGW